MNNLNATPVSPIYWMRENNRAKHYDYDKGRETTILSIMKRLEENVSKGQTPEAVEPIVANWAGNWAKWVNVQTVINSRTKQRRVILSAANPAVVMTLRPRLGELIEQLKPMGVSEVMFR